ncbi:SPARC-related modular calcium-binding protein 1 isoform X2 [Drosophila busckii]|uniref:SPARC-related modular calcium-binding protein 1 isoform X2 n=1 Tax=Drosophila busckii TaxID=30019 RepID=UPI00083F3210|nr:SPARC-related modular calcium-binding protein 1 isoform X2 [Drosophila busckii]
MFIKWLPLLLLLALLQLSNCLESKESLSLSECAAKVGECDEMDGPVCGTDDQTYPTRCHLERVQCSGFQVSLKHRGACKGCLVALQYAKRQQARNPRIFIPRCRHDGFYAAVQCLGDAGCWCSDSSGKPIKNTSSRGRKPKCGAYRRNHNRRRSSPRQLNLDADAVNSSDGAAPRACSRADRLAFNQHLIELFRAESVRSSRATGQADAAVLDWKFAQLDANGNQLLDRQEVRELKKLVKRAVKPRRCGRAFGKYCDVNKDDNLSRLEWSNCLSKNANHRNTAVDVLNSSSSWSSMPSTTPSNPLPRRTHYTNVHNIHHSNPSHEHTNTNIINNYNVNSHIDDFGNNNNNGGGVGVDEEEDYTGEEQEESMTHSYNSPLSPSSFNFLSAKTAETTNNESEGDANCWSDRKAARDDHDGTKAFFVPECTDDGRYQRVQCYSSYCWCVNEDTGKTIPETFSQEHKRPQCDEVVVVRPMKGCTEPRKTQFLKELKEFLSTRVLPPGNAANSSLWKSDDERIAKMSFVYLDKNKNKSWERKEWKVFRDLVTDARNLSRCGKKMPRYCDANGDKKISLSEWVDCLQSQRTESVTTAKPAQSNETATSRLLGFNPLEQYLKD